MRDRRRRCLARFYLTPCRSSACRQGRREHSIPSGIGGFAVGEGAVWSTSDAVSTLTRIDPERNAVVARVKVERRTTCPNAARLVTVRTVAWNGLDTTIKIPGKPNDVEVVALDATNRVIGKSKPVSVRSSRR